MSISRDVLQACVHPTTSPFPKCQEFHWGSAINRLGGTDTRPLLVVCDVVLSVGTAISG